MAAGPGTAAPRPGMTGPDMNDRQLLAARMIAALMDLEQAKDAMAGYSPRAVIMASTRGTLDNRLERHRATVKDLLKALAGPQAMATSWARFAALRDEIGAT